MFRDNAPFIAHPTWRGKIHHGGTEITEGRLRTSNPLPTPPSSAVPSNSDSVSSVSPW